MAPLLAVAAGGAMGSVLRYLLVGAVAVRVSGSFPWGTLAVNLLGAFAIGLCVTMVPRGADSVRALVVVGLLGGFTTFSAFSADTLGLLQSQYYGRAALNIIISVGACIGAAWAGAQASTWAGTTAAARWFSG